MSSAQNQLNDDHLPRRSAVGTRRPELEAALWLHAAQEDLVFDASELVTGHLPVTTGVKGSARDNQSPWAGDVL